MNKSKILYEQALKLIPGGVNSPVRSFNKVGGIPPFISSANGAYLYDEDGKSYIDYIGSWGQMILGHNNKLIYKAIIETAANGLSFGAPTILEIKMAKLVTKLVPSMDMIRMVNSGTEATMSAIRLARGYTKRDKFIKFKGCYHGHADYLLGNSSATLGSMNQSKSLGVPDDFIKHTLNCTYNNLNSVRKTFEKYPNDIACIIVEPVAGNMNCVLPIPRFLSTLRELCNEFGALLIMDEVITGFRVALGGAQDYYGVNPDLTCLGKIIGGGMPIGAFGGRRDIMLLLSPVGSIYQAGTLSGNPIAMSAGLSCLTQISNPETYKTLTQLTKTLVNGLLETAKKENISLKMNYIGSMFGIFFTDAKNIISYTDVKSCNIELFRRFFHLMLKEGVYFAPSAFEANFISLAHSEADILQTIDAAKRCFKQL